VVLRFEVWKLIHIPENYKYNSIILRGFFNDDCIQKWKSRIPLTYNFHCYTPRGTRVKRSKLVADH